MATYHFFTFLVQTVIINIWLVCLIKPLSCENLIINPGFEGVVHPWTGNSAITKIRNDVSHTGSFCVEVSYRIRSEQGISQHVLLDSDHYYQFKAFVKQLHGRHGDNNFKLYETYRSSILYTWIDNGEDELIEIAFKPFVQIKSGWVLLEAGFVTPRRKFGVSQLVINGPEADIDFLLDDVSIEELKIDYHWMNRYSTANIEKLRKSTVHMEVRHPPSYLPEDIQIKVDHKRHMFGFGCRVNKDWIVDPKFKEYREIFYKMFNWATIDDFDWTESTGTGNTPDYSREVQAMDELRQNGIELRGHSMFSEVQGKIPNWVKSLDGPALKIAIENRVNHIVNITRGKIHHWDVDNELLHGQFYEEQTRDPNMTVEMFNLLHQADPDAYLFLNDYDVVSSGAGTQAYIDLENRINSANVGLYGLGAQNYFISEDGPTILWQETHTVIPAIVWNDRPFQNFQLEILEWAIIPDHSRDWFHNDNLDNLSSNTSLPIWISGIRLNQNNVYTRANYLENVMRLYFGHPGVKGIILWGFWDHDTDWNSSLVNGFSYKTNRAGEKYLDLIEKEWSTHVVFNLSSGPIYPIKGFQGAYDYTVYYKGKPIKSGDFYLTESDVLVKIAINGTENEVDVPTTIDPFSYSTHGKHIWHAAPTMIGTMTARANNSDLQCTTRWSNVSDFGVEDKVHVLCDHDQVLTGCSSLNEDYDWLRGGESIELRSGKVACSAKSLASSTKGVYAIARCCKTFDMTCNYWTSNVDAVVRYEEMETDCQAEYLTTGCSTLNDKGMITEASPSSNHHGCYTQKPKDGGACCRVPTLTCLTERSVSNGLQKGDNATATCDDDRYIMTGCNVESYTGKTAGAFIERRADGKDTCVAVNGADKSAGTKGVVAVAVCCRLDKDRIPLVG